MEPDFFPQMGRYYSAYSLRDREADTITTVREGPFEYFDAVWYKTPRTLGTSCWVDAYDDYNNLYSFNNADCFLNFFII